MSDRYLRIVLTVIAVELAWIGVKDVLPTSAAAQGPPGLNRVVIAGVELAMRTQALPVAVAGGIRNVAMPPWAGADVLRVESGERPIRVELPGTINARITEPVRVDTSQPLMVRFSPKLPGASGIFHSASHARR